MLKERFKNLPPLLMFITLCLRANAAVFIVTDTTDTTKITSLRGAVMAANRMGGENKIILGQSLNSRDHSGQWVYRLTASSANEAAAPRGGLNITHGETMIVGMAPNVTIDATGLGDRVFQVSSNAQLILENLTIKGGTAPTGIEFFANGQFGGAICNSGTLILENCVITNNTSGPGQSVEGNGGGTGGGDGGAIYNNGRMMANGCTLAGNSCGAGVDGAFGGSGGGIRNDGYCDLFRCIINGNQAGAGGGPAGNAFGFGGSGGEGGGIFNSGTLILHECVIAGNATGAGASGGDPQGIVTIFSPAGWGGSGGSGGGIYNLGQLEVDFSAVYGNLASNGGNGGSFGSGGNAGTGGRGGGIFNAGELSLNTCTISSNSCGNGGIGGNGFTGNGASGGAGGSGGGIFNSGSNSMTSSTITLNRCGAGGNGGNLSTFFDIFASTNAASGGNAGDGGGIANDADVGAIVVRNTLIAQNLPNTGGAPGTNTITPNVIVVGQQPTQQIFVGNPGADTIGPDVAGACTSERFNLIGISDGSTGFTNGINADQIGSEASPINPLLGPLEMNGGSTPTHALLSGSPAIDQGNCFGIHRDQRGRSRPFISSSTSRPFGGDGSDIGAFELH